MSYADEVQAFAAYRNALTFARERYDASELERFEEDLAKAKASMDRAWLDLIPTQEKPSGL